LGTKTDKMNLFYGLIAAVLAAVFLGIFFFRRSPEALVVLCYKKTPATRRFEHLIRRLKNRRYHLSDETTFKKSSGIMLLFLDGYRSFYTNIFPILSAEKIPATVGLIPGWIGKYNGFSQPPWQDMMTQQELATLEKTPFISFAAEPLNGEDVSSLTEEEASFAISESIFRLRQNHHLSPRFAALPTVRPLPPAAVKAAENLPVFSSCIGVNFPSETQYTPCVLRVLFPDEHPLRTAYYLWKHRPR